MLREFNPVQLSPDTSDLVKLIAIDQGKEVNYCMGHSSSIDRITHTLNELKPYEESNTLMCLINPPTSIARGNIPDWVEGITQTMNSLENATHNNTISVVLSSRFHAVKVYKFKGTYIIFSSVHVPTVDQIYNYLLTVLYLSMEEDRNNFHERAATVLGGTSEARLHLTEEELELIKQYDMVQRINNLKSMVADLLKPKRPTRKIEELRQTVNSLEQDLNRTLNQLAKLRREDYIIQYLLTHTNPELIDDTMDYLEDAFNSGRLLDVRNEHVGDTNILYITNQSYIRLTEEDLDFVKPEAVTDPRHALFNKQIAIPLIRAAAEQRLRIPITAKYRIVYNDDMTFRSIEGVFESHDETYPPDGQVIAVSNAHITRFDCFSTHKTMVREAFEHSDLIYMFEVLNQCTGTINIFESPVNTSIIYDMERLSLSTPLQIKRDTGWEDITLKEFIKEEVLDEID